MPAAAKCWISICGAGVNTPTDRVVNLCLHLELIVDCSVNTRKLVGFAQTLPIHADGIKLSLCNKTAPQIWHKASSQNQMLTSMPPTSMVIAFLLRR